MPVHERVKSLRTRWDGMSSSETAMLPLSLLGAKA